MSNYIDPPRKLLKHLDRIATIQAGGIPAPVNVEIDLSNRCSLGCAGCHFAYVHSKGPYSRTATHDTGDLMDTSVMQEALLEMAEMGVRSVTWTGGGEPTLHPDFDELVSFCRIPQGLYTNGTHISPLRAALLKQTLAWAYVSLDYATRESYKANKQADRFPQAIEGIRSLVRANGKATIGVGFLLSADNIHEAPAMLELGKALGVDYIQFRPMILFDDAQPNQPSGSLEWIDRAVSWLEMVKGTPGVVADVNRFRMLKAWAGHPYSTCHWTQLQAVITPDARVWTCVNRRGFDGDCLGDLHNESFAGIWTRSRAFAVNEKCRVMCRGHIPNLSLSEMMQRGEHDAFV